jgi:hypothetical protein
MKIAQETFDLSKNKKYYRPVFFQLFISSTDKEKKKLHGYFLLFLRWCFVPSFALETNNACGVLGYFTAFKR